MKINIIGNFGCYLMILAVVMVLRNQDGHQIVK